MATVSLRFPPSAGQVRTVRLVAVSAVRRMGLDEARLDEVRLAVGEVCARAVRRCAAGEVTADVTLEVDDLGPSLRVVVTDHAGRVPEDRDEAVALALVRGLADEVRVEAGPGGPGGRVWLAWHREPG